MNPKLLQAIIAGLPTARYAMVADVSPLSVRPSSVRPSYVRPCHDHISKTKQNRPTVTINHC